MNSSFPSVCFRIVQYDTIQDIEVYVEYKEKCFDLPMHLPHRFTHRIQKQFAKNVYQIHSQPFDVSTIVCQDSLKENGMWITHDDLKIVGLTKPTVFGIPLQQPSVRWAFDVAYSMVKTNSSPEKIFVGYHGTSWEAYKAIQKENNLHASKGQLGYGVYVGSFWKACRFAGRNQDYEFREKPMVLRLLLKGNSLQELTFPREDHCTCKEWCEGAKLEVAQACAHDIDWNKQTKYTHGFLKPTQMSDGKWITKNEEWIFPSSNIVRLAEAVELKKETIAKPDYDPWQRNIEII